MKGWTAKLYTICLWIMRMAYVNFLWILFTMIGLVVFGIFPATIGMFAVMRKWLMGKTDMSVIRTFWNTYRKEFVKANCLGIFFFSIAILLSWYFRYFQYQQGIINFYFFIIFLFGFVVCLVTFLFFFPVFVHYDLSIFKYIRQSLLIAISRPMECIMMIGSIVVVSFILTIIPGLLPFFGGSMLSLVLMWVGLRAFKNIDTKIDKMSQH